jgi:hypothetical protein
MTLRVVNHYAMPGKVTKSQHQAMEVPDKGGCELSPEKLDMV